ncbi:GntR family transcriptional regulator [uncultured Tateyamaria sp.]|uniref:GntR family transcriptional regulator n=1 Tax=uncultured Tateyamaria sp. TaxID=455651 RepID=UPI0026308DCE|nr:GntR family transcriptional regulator [uncultured Tateyamaria sp.]
MPDLSIKPAIIADTLAEEIIRGDLVQGARLAQDHIAARFQCSHVPVREALQRLVQMELATAIPRKGVRVFKLSDQDHDEILEMRLSLEPLALRRAVTRATSQDYANMEVFRHACDKADDAISWERANRLFHLAILQPCDRPRLLSQIEQLQRLSAIRFHTRWKTTWSRTSDADHSAILKAIKRADEKAACAILVRHLSRG